MQPFDDGVDGDEQQEIHGRKSLRRRVHAELFPVGSGENDAGSNNSHPDQETEPTEEWPHERQPCFEETIGIEKRDSHGEWIHQPLLPLLALLLLIAVEKFLGVRRHVALEHVGGVQLAHQLNGFVSLDGVMAPMKDGERQAVRASQRADGKRTKGPAGYREVGCATLSFHDAEGERLSTVRMARMPESKKATLKSMLSAELDGVVTRHPELTLREARRRGQGQLDVSARYLSRGRGGGGLLPCGESSEEGIRCRLR